MKSNKILVSVIGGLVVLIGLLLLLIFTMLPKNTSQKQNLVLGGDKDKHGCIGSAGYSWDESKQKCIRSWEENISKENTTKENILKEDTIIQDKIDKNATNESYILAEKSELIPGGGRQHKYFSLYDQKEKLINTVYLPDDAMPNKAGSTATFGSKIYYLSGSDETTSIAELDPMTGKSHIFNFTKTKSTNVGNVLSAIVGWTVSDDNKMLAWVDTECGVHIANSDGTSLKSYNSDNGKCINAKIKFSKKGDNLYIWNSVNNFLREMRIDNGKTANIVKSENGLFLISPSERYIAYSNFDTPLAIRDFVNNKNIAIVLPKKYDLYYLDKFSPDEKTFYVTGAIVHGDEAYYAIETKEGKAKKVISSDNKKELDFLIKKGEHFVGKININN